MNKLNFKMKFVILLTFIFIFLLFLQNNCFAETVKTMKIVLDPGHGGHESGAVNYENNILEKDINLKTARYLRDYLKNYYGVTVLMTHDGNLSNNEEMEIVDRSMYARNNNADLLLCLHYNAVDSVEANWHGSEVYVTSNKSLYKYNEESTEIGNLILKNLTSLGLTSRGVKTRLCNDTTEKYQYYDGSRADYYGIIRYAMKGDAEDRGIDFSKGAGITTILIEHAFIRGSDVQFINTDEKLKKIAEADGKAVVEHYKLRLKKDVPNEIKVSESNLKMFAGDKQTVTATIVPDTAINKKVIWKSNDEKIAKVNSNGEIEAVSEGTTKILAIAEGNENVKKEITVEVIKPYIKIENGEEISVIEGKKVQLFKDIGKLTNKVTWESDDNEFATVDENGLVTTKKEGSAEITAKIAEYNLNAKIKINIIKLEEGQSIKIEDYKEENGVISKFDRETTEADFLKHIKLSSGLKAKVTKANKDAKYIGTASKIEIFDENNKLIQTYITKLYGDADGDGIISAIDYTLLKNDIMNVKTIVSNITKIVSDIDEDGIISAIDYTLIKNDIMGVKKIDKK